VLLVSFDTTRADHLGPYGYEGARTPTIDALAAEGTLLTRAYTTNPITLPAHTSLMTGTYPPFHGVRDNSNYFVREELETLAERLSAAGYDTAAFVGAFVLDSQFNLDQGFDRYDDQVERDWSRDEIEARERKAFGFPERKANLVSLAATNWLREREKTDSPFFMWLHYFDPHEPKNPPEPHRSLSPGAYDAEIAFADEQLGNVIREIQKQGRYDQTLVVFTADHGEGLLDHGEPTHSLLIFDSTIRVPMIFRIPGRQPEVDDQLASLVDVTPSVLDLLGLEPGSDVQGRSLFVPEGERQQRRAIYHESMVGLLQNGWSPLRGLRDGRWKLIHGSAPRLYDIEADPDDVFNLAQREPEVVREMEQRLVQFLAEHKSQETEKAVTEADEETARKLRSLGYIVTSDSATAAVTDDLVAAGEDPHRLRYLFDLFGIATENMDNDKVMLAISQLDEILAVDPENRAALNYLARAHYLHTGRVVRAKELLARSLELDPEQEEARYFLIRILFGEGNLDGAREQAEAILAFQPKSLSALYELGRIYSALGDEARAIRHYELALEIDPSNLPSLLALGVLHAQRGRNAEAGPYLKAALAAEPGNPRVLYNVGIWYLQAEDRPAAIRTLSQVVAISPLDPDAYYVLGRLLAQSGDSLRARPVLQRALGLNANRPDRVSELQFYLEGLQ